MDISSPDRQFKTEDEVDKFIQVILNRIILGYKVDVGIKTLLKNWINQTNLLIEKGEAINESVIRYANFMFLLLDEALEDFHEESYLKKK